MKKVTIFSGREVLIIAIVCAVFFSAITYFITTRVINKKELSRNAKDILDTYNEIVNNYYEDVDENELKNAAVNGMMDLLDEKYSVFLDDPNAFNRRLDGSYKGMGISIIKSSNGKFLIFNVIKDSFADKAGLKVADEILAVNGKVLDETVNVEDITEYIKDDKNVRMEIMRNKELKIFDVNIGNVIIPVVNSEVFINDDYNIGYIELTSFTDNSSMQFNSALASIEKENISGLIIDLRGNSGGYLLEATNIASKFIIKGKTIVQLGTKKKKEKILDETDESRNYPIVVLVNQYSASASEVLALALKENYGAYIVGTKTFGKGRVQQTDKLSDDSMIKYTSALWYSPKGNNIDGKGIKPSIYVELNKKDYKDDEHNNDNQLVTGINLIYNILCNR